MKILPLTPEFSVCKVGDYSQVDWDADFVFTGRTDEENSLVCPTAVLPDKVLERDDHWRAFRIEGQLDFSLVGILSRISAILADHHISIFALSTFNTDYILVKSQQFDQALALLAEAGYSLSD